MQRLEHWDIFCSVVDNYGDIGVSWRLARQLAQEHAIRVRLWVDDLASFHALRPEIDAERAQQWLDGVEVRRWPRPFPEVAPADVVIEAFACRTPDNYLQAMTKRHPPPVWVNLEYLSAEDWVEGCHGLPSPHPRLPLTQWFFFPGYTADTGGLLREAGLIDRVRAFQASPAAEAEFWKSLGLPPKTDAEQAISLFGYENPAIAALLQQWVEGPRPIRCLVPAGRILEGVAHFFGAADLMPRQALKRGALTVHCLPMLPQDRYDLLLWACDWNFVRGEDSCVRAQWAGRPMVWQAYPQQDDAHWPKLEAFMQRYLQGLAQGCARPLERLWRAWNAGDVDALDWSAAADRLCCLREHAARWAERLASQEDLASHLVQFCESKL
ncbi:MAG: elongation factor P maturation arginine rhamnosyltransferase EarP [Thiobacillaceae bacterium]